MRKYFFIIATLSTLNVFSQKVTISGTAFDTTNGRNWVHIVVNDTLRKVRESKTPNWDNYKKLTEDTTLNLYAKGDGKFSITANKTDSLFFQSFRHIPKVYCISDLLKMKSINIRLEPEICIPYVPCQDTMPTNFYIFVGQKLKVSYEKEPYYCDVETIDFGFKAEYKILEREVGNFPKDTICFTVFDHFGRPAFSKYENVLLFVGEYCGKLYHERYQYFDLYKTVEGKWASPGDPYKHDNENRKNYKAHNIQFADSVWFDITKLTLVEIEQQFPEPLYKIDGHKAIPLMGCYIDELMAVKKEGVLKTRKIKFN